MTHKTQQILVLLACPCLFSLSQMTSPASLRAATEQPTADSTSTAEAPDSLDRRSGLQLVLYRDAESLPLYVPEKDVVSLSGLTFGAVNAQGNRLKIGLGVLAGITGLDLAGIVGPACFQFVSNQR